MARQRRLRKVRLDSLKGLALDFDVDPEEDLMRPGNSPPERAFQLISCGFELLMTIGDHGLPMRGFRMQAKARKWILQDSVYRGAATSKMLAHLLPGLMMKLDGRLAADDAEAAQPAAVPVEHYARLEKAIQDFYPLPHKQLADLCLAEFTVMETKQPREEVQAGEEEGSEYSRALMRGEDPDQDPELVAIQRRWARDYFINKATTQALRVMLRFDFPRAERKLVDISDPRARRVSQVRARSLAAWIDGTAGFRQYALVDSAAFDNATEAATPSAAAAEPPTPTAPSGGERSEQDHS